MIKRMFAPSVQFIGAQVPVEDLVTNLRVCISFPMTDAEFVSWGAMLMEHLHCIFQNATADEGNEFLCCYADYDPKGRPPLAETARTPSPAQEMYPVLYLSDDNGLTWWDKPHLEFRRGAV